MKEEQLSLKKILQPYLLISIAGLLAFAPISFMLRALKNDIIALEYPINHFISQAIHNGEVPYWFNTWGMGFPLQSNLTWGVFSTPQMLFSSLFNYNIYILHIEFMFFVLLAGWGMFYLLNKHILKDRKLSQLLAICYMLSGFMVGSTQWLLYITAAAFIPLLLSSLLSLLNKPSIKNSIQFAIIYLLMFTSVYAAFNIITTYSLLIFIIIWLLAFEREKKRRITVIKYLGIAGFLTALFCLPCLYYTSELLNNIGRGSSIASDSNFFNSNYLHPAALSNLLLPFSSVKMPYSNTEGTMLSSYVGLFILLMLPAAIWQTIKERNKSALFILLSALIFLLVSFGDITPARNALNILPGFSYFRNPAIFRLYFILALIIFIAVLFRNKKFTDLFTIETKTVARTAYLLLIICIITAIVNIKSFESISFSNFTAFIKNINYPQSLLISALIQTAILALLLLLIKLKKNKFAYLLLVLDLIINTLICTPFFSVSSYSIPEVNAILPPTKGFPIQTSKPGEVATHFTDKKNNTWYNINIFTKEVSTNDSYRGPLTLNNFYSDSIEVQQKEKKTVTHLLFAAIDTATNSIQVLTQRPTHIRASVNFSDSTSVTLMQNYYPGWKAFYNTKEVPINHTAKQGMSIAIPKGKGVIDFTYERKTLWLSTLILHFISICFLIWKAAVFLKRFKAKSSSLS